MVTWSRSTAPAWWPCRPRRRSGPRHCAGPTAAGDDATDDAALVEAAGGRVVLVDGPPDNLKVTSPADLIVAAALAAVGRS